MGLIGRWGWGRIASSSGLIVDGRGWVENCFWRTWSFTWSISCNCVKVDAGKGHIGDLEGQLNCRTGGKNGQCEY